MWRSKAILWEAVLSLLPKRPGTELRLSSTEKVSGFRHWAIKQAPDLIIWKSASSTPPPPHLTVKIVNGEDEAQAWNPSSQHA